MKPQYLLFFSLALANGCDSTSEQPVPQAFADLDAAAEAIATSQDLEVANAAANQLIPVAFQQLMLCENTFTMSG